jgi:hypothetical protein
MITSFNGNRENKDIRYFVDDFLLARDSKALRDHIKNTQPDIDLTFFPDSDGGTKVNIPINISFFYPES